MSRRIAELLRLDIKDFGIEDDTKKELTWEKFKETEIPKELEMRKRRENHRIEEGIKSVILGDKQMETHLNKTTRGIYEP